MNESLISRSSTLFINQLINDIHFSSWGGVSPFSAEGTLYGIPFYFRIRHSKVSLYVGQSMEQPLYYSSFSIGSREEYISWAGDDEFVEFFLTACSRLKAGPRFFTYNGLAVESCNYPKMTKGSSTEYSVWADSENQAWELVTAKPRSIRGLYVSKLGLKREDVNPDTRVYTIDLLDKLSNLSWEEYFPQYFGKFS